MRLKINIIWKFSRVLLIQNLERKVIALDLHGCVYAVTPQPYDKCINAGTVGTAQIICSPTRYEMQKWAPIPIYQYNSDHLHTLSGHRFAVHISTHVGSDSCDRLDGDPGNKLTTSNLELHRSSRRCWRNPKSGRRRSFVLPVANSTSREVPCHRRLSHPTMTNAKLVLGLSQKTCLICTQLVGSAYRRKQHNLHLLLDICSAPIADTRELMPCLAGRRCGMESWKAWREEVTMLDA